MSLQVDRSDARRWLAACGYVALGYLVLLWAWQAFSDGLNYDTGLAYIGGQAAWATGHPEHLFSWTGTPFLAAVMAALTRVASADAVSAGVTGLNVVLVVAAVALVLRRLRVVLTPVWWWITAAGLLTFVPMMSSVWWKQFNIISLVLALTGFELLGRGREHGAGAAIGISVAFKPLAILLPFVLLARRQTRRAGALAIAYAIGLNLGAQELMAAHAHDTSALNPVIGLQNFSDKSQPSMGYPCSSPENFAPQSLLCRLVGSNHITAQRLMVWLLLALLGGWIFRMLRNLSATAWEVFAFACAISTMVSPIAWSHYQVMLAPLFVLLLVRFTGGDTDRWMWAGLLVALVLAELVWRPYGTLVDAIRLRLPPTWVANPPGLALIGDLSQFSQYVLLVTGGLWYARHRRRPSAAVDERNPSPAGGAQATAPTSGVSG